MNSDGLAHRYKLIFMLIINSGSMITGHNMNEGLQVIIGVGYNNCMGAMQGAHLANGMAESTRVVLIVSLRNRTRK